MAKGSWVFYYIQGQLGESIVHPNAFPIPKPSDSIVLQDIIDHFPLQPKGSFHFRFQVALGKKYAFMDLMNTNDPAPTFNGRIVMKVLRLGE